MQEVSHSRYVLLEEAVGYRDHGSPEAQVHAAVPPEGIPMKNLQVSTAIVLCNLHDVQHRALLSAFGLLSLQLLALP